MLGSGRPAKENLLGSTGPRRSSGNDVTDEQSRRPKLPEAQCGVGEWVWPGRRVRLTVKVVAGTTGLLGLLSRSGPYLLWFLFITHKSFAFY